MFTNVILPLPPHTFLQKVLSLSVFFPRRSQVQNKVWLIGCREKTMGEIEHCLAYSIF